MNVEQNVKHKVKNFLRMSNIEQNVSHKVNNFFFTFNKKLTFYFANLATLSNGQLCLIKQKKSENRIWIVIQIK